MLRRAARRGGGRGHLRGPGPPSRGDPGAGADGAQPAGGSAGAVRGGRTDGLRPRGSGPRHGGGEAVGHRGRRPAARPLAESGTAVVSFQNGVQKDTELRRHLPAESVLGGVGYISAFIEEPGVVVHNGTLQRLVFGEYDRKESPRARHFLDRCLAAGVDAEISGDIERTIWEKFVFLVGLSGTTSAVRQPIGVVRGNPGSRDLLRDVMREVVAVGRAKGVDLDPGFADDRLAFCDTLPATMTSSMHNDLLRGNRLELGWLSGAVADLGAELAVATPRNRAIADILAPCALGDPAATGGADVSAAGGASR
ncbi:ketopantoate reductase family protein [Streptomyces indonesiensis]